ncbi:hypothetical protein J3458_001968 [Metarhizium acridum]|uniref:uncharacterized protein n=1 Tax=Metarhizium acridum TaxID=92637 RepID=UPI001C6B6D96|nr:hypothetical protein J3458_001968 [Metarhizium acridum]
MPTAPPSRPPTTYLDDEDLGVKCCTPITSLRSASRSRQHRVRPRRNVRLLRMAAPRPAPL